MFYFSYSGNLPDEIKKDEWEVFPKSITLDGKIGEGAFGTVFSAYLEGLTFTQSNYAKRIGGATLLDFGKSPKVAVKLLKGKNSNIPLTTIHKLMVKALSLRPKGSEFSSPWGLWWWKLLIITKSIGSSADLEVQLMQLNHCDGVLGNYWKTLLRQ